MGKKIYLASSWRNSSQPRILSILRAAGHEVYDFRNPEPGSNGFSWRQVDSNAASWDSKAFREALKSPVSRHGFLLDFEAMQRSEEFCLLLPSGRSAHLEAGWAIGKGKRTSIMIEKFDEPELMYLTGGTRTAICISEEELLAFHAEHGG